MKATELLTKCHEALDKTSNGLQILEDQAKLRGTYQEKVLYDTLGHLSAANCALQSFECLVRTGEQPKSGE